MPGIAWCTGAGKGIGRAVSLRLAAEGWRVAASARTADDLENLAAAAANAGAEGGILPFPLDVTDEAAVATTVGAIEAQAGPLDLVILNAGTHIPMTAAEFAVAPVRTLIETNVMGVVHGLAAVMPRMIGRRRGTVAVVASVAGYFGLPSAAGYGAGKAALINMCEALKPDLDRHGVRMVLIDPGFVRTPLTDRNDFPMPFLMDVDDAAARIVRGLGGTAFEIAFPRRLAMPLKLLRLLPYRLAFALTRTFLR